MEENSYKPERIGKYAAENNRVQGGGGWCFPSMHTLQSLIPKSGFKSAL